MIRVIIESPYAGDIERNKKYLNALMLDCLLNRGESPIASHKLYTDILNDLNPEERSLGIDAGLIWSRCADKIVVGADLGISEGMEKGLALHRANGIFIEFRSLPNWENK